MKIVIKLRGFTLIELLLLIIIIWILAAAILSRIVGIQGRVRDAARRSHIQQISNALGLYASDNLWEYPDSNGQAVCIWSTGWWICWPWYIHNSWPLWAGLWNTWFNDTLMQYMSSVPTDPLSNRAVWDRYIYRKSWQGNQNAPSCWGAPIIYWWAWLAWQPDKINPKQDECSPGVQWCCSWIGCWSHTFCMIQLN